MTIQPPFYLFLPFFMGGDCSQPVLIEQAFFFGNAGGGGFYLFFGY